MVYHCCHHRINHFGVVHCIWRVVRLHGGDADSSVEENTSCVVASWIYFP